ncbi:hypothetical protein [Avibacterium sp. 21-599]|uniref:hypothetical protein n=1 Tax=Avibacterium sp. 21-599 TaxID=2911528 RepID=UPI002248722C|nr:hypothetical protein [Avibacterium sp. 21-599]MCW9717787.1 hypothetical protein [Avibacterium sp. 21-599]
MQVLYYMDPFIDLKKDLDERSFIAKMDLNADFLGRYSKTEKDLQVTFVALESILEKRNIKNHLQENNVKIIAIPDQEIQGILDYYNTTIEMIITENASEKARNHFIGYFKRKLKNLNPEFIIYWEYCSEIFSSIYPNSIYLEGQHSGFWRLEKNSDILFNISTKDKKHHEIFFEEINKLIISQEDKKDIDDFRQLFHDTVLFKTQIDREYLDPERKFNKLIFYPGNFPSLRFKQYSGFSTNSEFLQYLLEVLPEDYGIVYTKHAFDSIKDDYYINSNPRIILLDQLAKVDADLSIKILPYVDAVVNIYSNIFMPTMLTKTPIFSFGTSPNAKFALGNLENISEWLQGENKLPSHYLDLCNKTLKYVLTHKINTRLLRNSRNSYLYLKNIKNNINQGKSYLDYLPLLGTIRGYTNRFFNQRLLNNSVNTSYTQTKLEIMIGHLLNNDIKNIGFDIFDTLLYRPTLKPTDVFDLIEEDVFKLTKLRSFNFSKSRIAAEMLARYGKIEVTLDDIYNELERNTGFSKEIINKIKHIECNIEKQILCARETLLEYFNLTKYFEKNIFIASDMYLSKNILCDILTEKGFDLSNVKVYISSEVNKVKYNGSLFKYILHKEKYTPNQTVFIGDNEKSDVIQATNSNLIAFHYPRAIEQLKKTTLFRMDILGNIISNNFSFHIGLIANKIFDNPFVEFDYNTSINNSSSLFGYFIFGPLALSLTEWLISNSKKDNIDKLLFSSRDARVVFDVYKYINQTIYNHNLPEEEYIYLSRTSTLPAYTNQAHRMTLLSLYNSKLSTKDYLKYLFDIDVDNKDTMNLIKEINLNLWEDSNKNKQKISIFIQKFYERYKENSEKENIERYFKNIIKNKKVAIFDLGARGTSRDILSDLLQIDIPLYLFRETRYKCENNNINSYLKDTQNSYRHGVRVILPLFYELLLSDTIDSTCSGYKEKNGIIYPIVGKTEYTKTSLLVLNSQTFMKLFCKNYIDLFKEKFSYINSQTKDTFIFPLSYLCSNTTDTILLNQYYGEDPIWKDEKIPIIFPNLKRKIEKKSNTSIELKSSKPVLKKEILNNELKRKAFLYFKHKFYKWNFSRRVWDKGRTLYLKIFQN